METAVKMELLNSEEFRAEYLKHQVEDNYNRFLIIPLITGIIGLLFLILTTYEYLQLGVKSTTSAYYILWSFLILASIAFRIYIPFVNKKNNPVLLDKTILIYATVMCCIAASVTALDLMGTNDLTVYSYTLLGMATAYRANIRKYLFITTITMGYFCLYSFLVLKASLSIFTLLPILVMSVMSIFIAVSLEKNRKKMVRLSVELEATNQRLMQESMKDPLTDLYNRRYLRDYLERKIKQYGRAKEPLCVAICDLDHFKKINDELGHLVGDSALEMFAKLIKEVARETDVQIRFGGEEFVIVMPKTKLNQALVLIERLRSATTELVFEQIPWSLSVSVGLTQLNNMDSYDTLLARADKFVYEAKSRGRNQVVVG